MGRSTSSNEDPMQPKINKKIKIKKMGGRTEWTFFQRGNAEGQQAHEKMFNITNHQGNANQNHNEISPDPIRMGGQKEHK